MNCLSLMLLICIVIIIYLWVDKKNYAALCEQLSNDFDNVLTNLKHANRLCQELVEKNQELRSEIARLKNGKED